MKKYIGFLLFLALVSCEEKPFEVVYFDFAGEQGVFVLNEGNFMYGNSSLTYYDPASQQAFQDVFFARNSAPLGDVSCSMQLRNASAWIVVNNSGKIYRIDAATFAFEQVFTGFLSPRHMLFLPDGSAYVSDLYDPRIVRIDPSTGEWIDAVELEGLNLTGKRSTVEEMILSGNTVYANCWLHDHKILKIDIRSNRVVDSLRVPLQPVSMVTDHQGLLWVLTDGGYSGSPVGEEQAALLAVDTSRFHIRKILRFPAGEHPRGLAASPCGKQLYYLNRHLFSLSVHDQELPENPMVPYCGGEDYPGFYSLGVDPGSGDIYLSDPVDYTQNGRIYRYSADTLLVDSIPAGINPGYFCFTGDPL